MKRTRLHKLSVEPVAKIKCECMGLVKRIVSIRDNDTCQKCDERVYGSNRHRSHVIPVSAGNKLAFDPMNIKILCFHHHQWWHLNPTESGNWFRTKFPERQKYLDDNKGILKMYYDDWLALREKLNRDLEILL